MAPNFNPSSFIPEEPLPSETPQGRTSLKSTNFLLVLGGIMFGFSLLLAIGVFGYKKYIENSVADKKQRLQAAQEAFNPDVIDKLTALEKRLKVAGKLLSQHTVVSPVFALLQKNTLQSVQFTSFQYQNVKNEGKVKMKGVAHGYPAVALQSQRFAQKQEIRNPVFSQFSRQENGDIRFSVKFAVAPSTLSYENMISENMARQSTSTSNNGNLNNSTSTSQ